VPTRPFRKEATFNDQIFAEASNIGGFIYTSMNGFTQSALNFTSQNVGAKRLDRVPQIRKYCLFDVALVGIVLGTLSFVFARQLLGIYLTDLQEAIEIGVRRIIFLCLPYFICGMQEVTTGMIRGLGSSLVPMIVCVVGICGLRVVWIKTIFQIERFHTLDMLFVTYPLSWIVVFAILVVCYRVVYKRKLQ